MSGSAHGPRKCQTVTLLLHDATPDGVDTEQLTEELARLLPNDVVLVDVDAEPCRPTRTRVPSYDEFIADYDYANNAPAGALRTGDLFCEDGMEPRRVVTRADYGNSVVITDHHGVTTTLHRASVVMRTAAPDADPAAADAPTVWVAVAEYADGYDDHDPEAAVAGTEDGAWTEAARLVHEFAIAVQEDDESAAEFLAEHGAPTDDPRAYYAAARTDFDLSVFVTVTERNIR